MKYLSFIAILIAISNFIGPMPHIGGMYPLVILALLLFYLQGGTSFRLNIPMLALVCVAAISTLLNHPPTYFRSYERLGLFLIVAGLVSPLIQNDKLIVLRRDMFVWMLRASVAVTILSFLGYFVGINYMSTTASLNGVGSFGGITYQSMVLGPIAATSFCYILYLSLIEKKTSRKKIIILWSGIVFSLLTVLLTASRSALLAGFVGGIVIIYKIHAGTFSGFLRYLLGVICVALITYPLWQPYTINVLNKQKGNIETGGTTSSRDSKWEARTYEFKSSPLWGVGYFAALEDSGDDIDKTTGQIEFGTSWGAALSTLGLLGFIPLAWLFLENWYFLFRKREDTGDTALFLGILSFFMVHMIAEGYIFGAGSYLFFMVWLTLGAINAYRIEK